MLADGQESVAVLQGVAVGLARTVGFVSTFPLFTWLEISGILRMAIAFGLALPFMGEAVTREMASASSFVFLFLTFGKEALLGVGLGLLFGAPIWAMQGMGDVIEMYRGASMEGVYESTNASEVTEAGRLFMVLGMGWFVHSGALNLMLEWFFGAYAIWPIYALAPTIPGIAGWEWGVFLDWLQRYAIVLGAPFLILMFLVDAALGFATVSGKRLSVGDLSSTGKNTVFLFALPVYLIFSAIFFAEALRQYSTAVLVTFGARP